MNLKYKLGATALASIAMTSCETNDPFSDIMDAGQPVPTVSWSVGSTMAAAGDSIEISGKYYTDNITLLTTLRFGRPWCSTRRLPLL